MIICIIIFILISNIFFGYLKFNDPEIPDGEICYYISYEKDNKDFFSQEVRIFNTNNNSFYNIITKSKSQDTIILVEKETMIAKIIKVIQKENNVILNRTIELISNNTMLSNDEAPILEFYSIFYYLRGYPFNKVESVKLKFLGNDNSFPIIAKYLGKEKIKTSNNKIIECYKIQLTVDNFWAKFFPSVYFWYSIEKPHYLVKYEGNSGPPGSSKRIIELFNYSINTNR